MYSLQLSLELRFYRIRLIFSCLGSKKRGCINELCGEMFDCHPQIILFCKVRFVWPF